MIKYIYRRTFVPIFPVKSFLKRSKKVKVNKITQKWEKPKNYCTYNLEFKNLS